MCLWLSRPRISRLSLTRIVVPFCLSAKLSLHAPYTQRSRSLTFIFIYYYDCASTRMMFNRVSLPSFPFNRIFLTFPNIPRSLVVHPFAAYASPIRSTIGNSAYMDRFATLRILPRHFRSAFSLPTNRVLISLLERVGQI